MHVHNQAEHTPCFCLTDWGRDTSAQLRAQGGRGYRRPHAALLGQAHHPAHPELCARLVQGRFRRLLARLRVTAYFRACIGLRDGELLRSIASAPAPEQPGCCLGDWCVLGPAFTCHNTYWSRFVYHALLFPQPSRFRAAMCLTVSATRPTTKYDRLAISVHFSCCTIEFVLKLRRR